MAYVLNKHLVRQVCVTMVAVLFVMGGLATPFVPTSFVHSSKSVVPQFGVPKLTAASTGSNTYWVGASSNGASALPNSGVQCTIQVASTKTAVNGDLSFWCSDETSNGMWGQVGYYIDGGTTPTAFWQIWNLNTNTYISTGTTSVSQGYHTFAMCVQSGTTWAFSIDGHVFGTYNMGSSVSDGTGGYPVYALSEEGYTSSPFSFPAITFSTAMEVLNNGAWNPVVTSLSYGSAWGTEGSLQNSSLNNDTIVVGSSVPQVSSSVALWNGLPSSSSTSTSTTSMSMNSSASSSTSSSSASYSSTTTSSTAMTKTSHSNNGHKK